MELPKMEQPILSKEEIQEIQQQALKEEAQRKTKERMAKARAARGMKVKKTVFVPPPPTPPIVPTPAPAVGAIAPEEKIMFFTESDIDKKTGKIVNTYPSYFNRKQKDDLEEEIRRLETGLDNNYFPREKTGEIREQLKKAKTAYEKSMEIKPHFEKNKDTISKMVDGLGEEITRSMFTRSEVQKGLADSHEEARRMSEPVIELDNRAAQIAQDNGILLHEGRKVTRTDAVRLWQLGRYALGEMRDAEVLRRD